jgi:hypothetical protein
MIRVSWFSIARSAYRSLLCRLAVLHTGNRQRRRALRSRLRRRNDFTFGPVAAELCEPRQLLSAAVSAVSPNQAATQGGNTIQISGSGFTGVTGVMFGTTPAASYSVNSANHISAVAPSHAAGQVDIVVDTMTGNSPTSSADLFNYTAIPRITSAKGCGRPSTTAERAASGNERARSQILRARI